MLYSLDFDDKVKVNIIQLLKNISFTVMKYFTGVEVEKITAKVINKEKASDINSFKDSLEQIVLLIKNQLNKLKEKNKRVIFVFDEMDRCTTSQIIQLLNIIKNVFFRFKENIFFIVCCNSEHIDKMLMGNNDEPFTNKIFDKVINIDYLINNETLFLTNPSNNYLIKFWSTRNKCIRIKEKVMNSVNKIINECLIQEDKEKFENVLFNDQITFLLNMIYFQKHSDKNDDYKLLIENMKNIYNMNDEILNLLSGFNTAISLLTNGVYWFPNSHNSISVYDRIKKSAPFGSVQDISFKRIFLYVEMKNNCRVPLSFFLPFFQKWQKFDNLKNNLYTDNSSMKTGSVTLFLKYELIRENIMPSFREGLDMLADEIKNYNYVVTGYVSREFDKFFYIDILTLISKTLFD